MSVASVEDSGAFGSGPTPQQSKSNFRVSAPGAVVAPTSIAAPVASPRTAGHKATVGYADEPAGFVVGGDEELDVTVHEDTQVPGGGPPVAIVPLSADSADDTVAATGPDVGPRESSLEELFAAAEADGQITDAEIEALQNVAATMPVVVNVADTAPDVSISSFSDTAGNPEAVEPAASASQKATCGAALA